MSTLTMQYPARQPFASLNGTRLRSMTNIKNKQNALPSSIASSLKRHAPSNFNDVDTENVDPLLLLSPSKKARTFDSEAAPKTNLFTLTPAKGPAQYIERAQVTGQKRKAEEPAMTPRNDLDSNKRVQPSSAPAPAGRSPKGKKLGILSRRRMTSSPFTRINPPTSSSGESMTGLPFSIDAALAGTIPTQKSKSKTSSRKGWHFDIYEDTPDEEMANLMEHSTCTLDISDDESRRAAKEDRDNKENIPPVDGPAAIGISTTQAVTNGHDMMIDTARSPLGELNAKDYYASGCDCSSFVLVPADETDEKAATISNIQEACMPAASLTNAIPSLSLPSKDFVGANVLLADSKFKATTSKEEPAEIQIWESESAKGDEDTNVRDLTADASISDPVLDNTSTV